MRRYEVVAESTVVYSSDDGPAVEARPMVAHTPEDLVELIGSLSEAERATAVVAVDPACSTGTAEEQGDCVIALASVLVDQGVTAIETHHVTAVKRVFTTYRAITDESIEMQA